ncbi:MAG: MFS transporter [Verrucomicrobiales bacterium]|nr:MFS transporter [Verrucomicrobiales bacterium]
MTMNSINDSSGPWYRGVTRYEWLVLIIASLGWIFDVYEGQIFNLTRNQLLQEILGVEPGHPDLKTYGDRLLGIFLLGGMFGGVLFGSLADKYGRRPIMIMTILMYSVFAGLTYFATNLEQVMVLRFLVAMGIGGEWAVAAALVAEVFPTKARAHASGIFHATSVIGTWTATLAALLVGTEWRYAYLIGVLPALLIVWVRITVKEPEKWRQAKVEPTKTRGSLKELFTSSPWAKHAVLAMCLAAVGLGTFWALVVAGQNLAHERMLADGVPEEVAVEKAKFAYGIVQTVGGGIGLVLFGPIAARLGRKKTFILYHLGAAAIVPMTCFLPQSYGMLLLFLPVFGFFTLGMHAGYAVYFPELFPNHLRATGSSVGFNGGRMLAFAVLWYLAPWLKTELPLPHALTCLGALFLVGAVLMFFLPETKGKELPT